MKYLLDTHALIWFMTGDTSLSKSAITRIKNKKNNCIVSIASIWEIAIKTSLGKLHIDVDLNEIAQFLINNDIEILPIEFNHLQVLMSLKTIHRDPFDRIIISQAISGYLTIITKDQAFKDYPVKILW